MPLLLVDFGSRCQQGVVALCGVCLACSLCTRQDAVVLSWSWVSVISHQWLPLFLMMVYKESVSVRLILDLIQMIWSRVLTPCPWKLMRDLWDLDRTKCGSLQTLLSHHLPWGFPMHSGVKRSLMNPCQVHDLWLVIPRHASILILPSHMRPMERLDSPSGRRSSATFSRSVLTLAFHTVYVMVDTRNLKAHGTAQDGLPHWLAAVAWWCSRVQLVGPQQEKTELLFQPGLGPLSSLLWCLFSLALTSSCWTVTACQLHSSKQPIYGRKAISQDFPQELEKVYLRSTRCTESVTMLTVMMLSTRNIGLMPIGRDRVSFLSLGHTLNSMLDWW